MVREMAGVRPAQEQQEQEPPPKYEELEEELAPPGYTSCVLEIREEEKEIKEEENRSQVRRNQEPRPENLAVMEQTVRRFV